MTDNGPRQELFELLHPIAAVDDEDGNRERIPDIEALVAAKIKDGDGAQGSFRARRGGQDVAHEGHYRMRRDHAIESRELLWSCNETSDIMSKHCFLPSLSEPV